MRIYAACLASYNNGNLHGEWIDVEGLDAEDIQEEINEMLKSSPALKDAEEWAIHDYDDFPNMGEYPDLEELVKIAEIISEFGDGALALIGYGKEDAERYREQLEDNYLGSWENVADWAEDYLNDTGDLSQIPESLRYYFDLEKYARDLILGGDIRVIEYGRKMHIFWNN